MSRLTRYGIAPKHPAPFHWGDRWAWIGPLDQLRRMCDWCSERQPGSARWEQLHAILQARTAGKETG